ncbi:hypothetical protein WOLCODRAFT_138442 [Wolfiporia cocos MD-104 SS10]|uniref:Uncharacterized protein n=1 Tax=Wolfiporia cocos (strain MD-104) TaxID=742152 RepID=A0A2H3JN18_WOLCO|nr:hypothetical protein WOLCODRAFT_138442 [Wolfiporia cocos MD-104 SS10]
MPARAHRGALPRTHTRTNSGGSSKLGLNNLQFTQKDAPPPRTTDKSRKSPHAHHEPAARAVAPLSRNGSSHRIASREHIQPAPLRRAPTPLGPGKPQSGRQRADFTISGPSEGDDDEWVSSESGAATPNSATDSDGGDTTTPLDRTKSTLARTTTQLNGYHTEDVATPRADAPLLPRVDVVRASEPPSPAPTARDYIQAQPTPQMVDGSQHAPAHDQRSPPQAERPPEAEVQPPPQAAQPPETQPPPITRARSETRSPTRTSPPPKRQSMTRPPSTHSVTSKSEGAALRPHPLIRGHSYGHHNGTFAAMPAPLAPLTMVSSDAAQAEMSTASSPTSVRAGSPSSIKTASASPSQSSPTSSQAHRQLRRTSTSSARSTSTLPVSVSQSQLSKSSHDRQRTLSTISSSSSFAALSSLAMRATPSPPRTPVTYTAHFPPAEQSASLELIHPLLPPPYLSSHITVLAYRNPIAESYDRVICAKQAR